MNVSLQNLDKVSAELTVQLEKADYQEKVDKSLKDLRKKARVPGFRPGMVPLSLMKKMYGKSVLAEEVNKAISEAVNNYIKNNKVKILAEPLPKEGQPAIDFNTMEDFEVKFDIALEPEFDATPTKGDQLAYYNIDVTDELVDKEVKVYTERNGKYEKVDTYQGNDMLKGLLAELDGDGNAKENGIQVENAVMMPAYMKNEEQKAAFAGAKVNDAIVFNPSAAWGGSAVELASLLKIDKEKAAEIKSDFKFQVEEITRFVESGLDQELFDQVFGKGVVKSEEEFRAKVKDALTAQFAVDSDYRFLVDAHDMLMKKAGKLEFAAPLLKRFIRLNNPEQDEKAVDENYDKNMEALTWQLIKERLVEAYNIKVENEDIQAMARETTRAQFARYGMLNVPAEVLDSYVKDMLKKKESVNNLVNRIVENKLSKALKSQVTLEEKTVSLDEFNKLFKA